MKLEPERSPCRPHPCSVEHADMVWTFRDMQRQWEDECETMTRGYITETREFERDSPRPTLRDFLVMRRR